MSKVVESQPEYELAKSFSVMTVLQPTKLYFVDAQGVQIAENLDAVDVVVSAAATAATKEVFERWLCWYSTTTTVVQGRLRCAAGPQ